jgi:hypothetical protein
MAVKAWRSVSVNRTGSFLRLSLIFLHIHSYIDHSRSNFFYLLTFVFPHFCFRLFECFLILLLLQRNDPIPQTCSLLFRFCGYRRQTVLALLDILSTEEPLLAESCLHQPFLLTARWRLPVISFPLKEKTIRRCRLYPRQSRRYQHFRFASPLLCPFLSRAVTKENPHQPTPPYPLSWKPIQQSQQ